MKAAFTLIELLVVVAVVAVIAGVAFPVYQNARVSSSRVVALGALRQMSMAGNLYLADNQQRFWRFRSDTAEGTTYWFGYETAADASLPEGSRTVDYERGALGPYNGGLHDVHPDPQFTRVGNTFKPKFKNGYIPYGYNTLLQNKPVTSILNLSKRVVFATSAQVNTFQPPASPGHPMLEEFYLVDDFNVTASFRYHGRALCAFADGSTGFLDPQPNTLDARLPGASVGKLPLENLK